MFRVCVKGLSKKHVEALVGRGGLKFFCIKVDNLGLEAFCFQPFGVEYLAIKHLALTSLISLSSLFAKVE